MNERFSEHSGQEPVTPSQEIAWMLSQYGEEAGFDSQTLDELAREPFEEAFETAYSYLTQAGIDADEALAPWIEPEPNE
jgi:hypothetical protein